MHICGLGSVVKKIAIVIVREIALLLLIVLVGRLSVAAFLVDGTHCNRTGRNASDGGQSGLPGGFGV